MSEVDELMRSVLRLAVVREVQERSNPETFMAECAHVWSTRYPEDAPLTEAEVADALAKLATGASIFEIVTNDAL